MTGVKIVEEPTDDLWFAPDQCVVPEAAAEQFKEAGFFGLGDFYDPEPWRPADPEYGQLIEYMRTLEYPSPEREAELERMELERTMEEWRKSLPIQFMDAPVHVIDDILNKVFYLSVNTKTGYSFNIRIAGYRGVMEGDPQHRQIPGTCVPTQWCMDHCYAKTAHFVTWDKQHWKDLSRQQARYLQNLIVSQMYAASPQEEIDAQADAIYEAVREKFYTVRGARKGAFPEDTPINLRWNGGGDFNLGTIRIVNAITERHPDMIVWGFTRRADTAGTDARPGIVPRPNAVVNVSLDPSTPASDVSFKKGFRLEELVGAARQMDSNLVYATHIIDDPRLNSLRDVIRQELGGDVGIATVFGYHCGSLHTTIRDYWECSATDPRVYGGCQECRWCMMSREIRDAENVFSPNQAFFEHGGEPDIDRIEEENDKIEAWNERHPEEFRPYIEPMTEEEVWG
jgi:hypothetical protein